MVKMRFAVSFCILFMGILLIKSVVQSEHAFAQQPGWAPRARIPGSHDLAPTPWLVEDSSGTIHAFLAQGYRDDDKASETAIFYARWTLGEGWSNLIDVILPPFGDHLSILGVVADEQGMAHLAFISGQGETSKVFYSNAPLIQAGYAKAWLPPVEIDDALGYVGGALAGDGKRFLGIMYSQDGSSIVQATSLDRGETWSTPTPVLPISAEDRFAYGIRLFTDADGIVHAVWTENSLSGTGRAIFYARLAPDDQGWSEPHLLAKAPDFEERMDGQLSNRVEFPSIVKHENSVIVLYTVCDPCEKRMQFLPDGGQWEGPFVPFDSRGSYGFSDGFVEDAGGKLHLLLVDRARGNNLWHAMSLGGSWGMFDPVVPQVAANLAGSKKGEEEGYQPYDIRAISSRGNILLVTWTQDPGFEDNGAWYSYQVLDIAPLPSVTLPEHPPLGVTRALAPSLSVSATEVVPLPTTSLQPILIPARALPPPPQSSNVAEALMVGVVPTGLLIGLIVGGFLWIRRRR